MGSFDFLGAEQTVFSNPDALDFDFVPKLLPHREEQQRYIATGIAPLLQGRSGKHILIRGPSGIGKTAATKRVLMDLEDVEEADNVAQIFINCWKANTSYKVVVEIAHALKYPFTQNMNTNEIFAKITDLLKKKKGVVFVFDEIDKAEDFNFLYIITEELKKHALVLITNDFSWGANLDSRIKSRLALEVVEFNPYTPAETEDILRERLKYAFYRDVWGDDAFLEIAKKSAGFRDIRVGIMLLKAAGEAAEGDSSKKVLLKHAESAIEKTDEFKIKTSSDFTETEKLILNVCRQNSGETTGKLYKLYLDVGGKGSDKTFKRKLDKFATKKILNLEQTGEGFSGKSTIINYIGFEKKLTEF